MKTMFINAIKTNKKTQSHPTAFLVMPGLQTSVYAIDKNPAKNITASLYISS